MSPQIRLCIFLISSDCVGLPALIWALHFLHLHRKIRGRISAFILLLFANDVLQFLLNLHILTLIFTNTHIIWYPDLFEPWSTLSLRGFLLHQLVALEGILILKYPQFSVKIFTLPCYITICLILLVFSISNVLFSFLDPSFNVYISFFSLGTSLVPLSLLAVTFTIPFKAFPIFTNRNKHLLFAVAMVTFVMVYFPFILVSYLDVFMDVHISWFDMSVCLMSLRLISDPLLCVLVCRENLRDDQTPETHTEPDADQMAG